MIIKYNLKGAALFSWSGKSNIENRFRRHFATSLASRQRKPKFTLDNVWIRVARLYIAKHRFRAYIYTRGLCLKSLSKIQITMQAHCYSIEKKKKKNDNRKLVIYMKKKRKRNHN